jgi:hypothetical protein
MNAIRNKQRTAVAATFRLRRHILRRLKPATTTIICFLFLSSCIATSPYYRYETRLPELEKPPYLQVLLTQYHNVDDANLTIEGSFRVYNYEPVRRNGFIASHLLSEGQPLRDVRVTTDLSGIVVGNLKLAQAYDVVIVPSKLVFRVGQTTYQGYLTGCPKSP